MSLYSLFLNPKGKIISDALIIRPIVYEKNVKKLAENELWIDVAAENNTKLFEHLNRYTWKKKVMLSNMKFEQDAPSLYAGFVNMVLNVNKSTENYDLLKNSAGKALLKSKT